MRWAAARGKWDPECTFRFELPGEQPLVCHPPTAECVEQVCPHNTSHCKDQHTREFCNETGSAWLAPSPCAQGLICVESDLNAVCSPVLCQPGTLGCRDEQTVQVCNDNGTDWVLEACGQGQSCDPREYTCEDRICDPDAARCCELPAPRAPPPPPEPREPAPPCARPRMRAASGAA